MSIADAMVANGMQEFGYEYINMDGELYILSCFPLSDPLPLDCWADHRDSNGNIVPDKNRFPE